MLVSNVAHFDLGHVHKIGSRLWPLSSATSRRSLGCLIAFEMERHFRCRSTLSGIVLHNWIIKSFSPKNQGDGAIRRISNKVMVPVHPVIAVTASATT